MHIDINTYGNESMGNYPVSSMDVNKQKSAQIKKHKLTTP